MNDELQQALARFLDRLLAATEQGADFAIEQAPLVIQEYLAWGWAAHMMGVALGLALLLVITPGAFFVAWRTDYTDVGGASFFIGTGALISGLIIACVNASQLVKIAVSPRVYLIEQIKDLVS